MRIRALAKVADKVADRVLDRVQTKARIRVQAKVPSTSTTNPPTPLPPHHPLANSSSRRDRMGSRRVVRMMMSVIVKAAGKWLWKGFRAWEVFVDLGSR